ncbi:MAG: hypothetical protein R6U37_09375 [Dehalococcoidia bacterium]
MIDKLRKFFSGKLVIVQLSAGVGAFVFRSLAAFLTSELDTWVIVLAAHLGSFSGYIGSFFLGYWLAFRKDYSTMDRSMGRDIVQLQLVEQTPNIWTVISSAISQTALLETTDLGSDEFNAVFSSNIASWFGPHKVLNFAAMLTSNSLKKAWVDHTWHPMRRIYGLWRRIRRKSYDV